MRFGEGGGKLPSAHTSNSLDMPLTHTCIGHATICNVCKFRTAFLSLFKLTHKCPTQHARALKVGCWGRTPSCSMRRYTDIASWSHPCNQKDARGPYGCMGTAWVHEGRTNAWEPHEQGDRMVAWEPHGCMGPHECTSCGNVREHAGTPPRQEQWHGRVHCVPPPPPPKPNPSFP
jgi:hypothetical protein